MGSANCQLFFLIDVLFDFTEPVSRTSDIAWFDENLSQINPSLNALPPRTAW
jgi:hypothetical protein